MSGETPANLLRRAAARIDEATESATRLPWRVCAEGSEGSRFAPATGDKREQSRFIGIANGRVQPEDGHNAALIVAAVNAVPFLGAWLKAEAQLGEYRGQVLPAAIDVARTVLGESS